MARPNLATCPGRGGGPYLGQRRGLRHHHGEPVAPGARCGDRTARWAFCL